ncbi:MAG: hypothetical protein HOV81_11475 [Kofleriaceae bacterium]|nr:hypothetical protein [Kofleriaceae bacterium]
MALKTKLLTMLLIGSSSVAVAGPMVDHRVSANVGFGGSVTIRDHRDGAFDFQEPARFYGPERARPQAQLLASGLHYERTQYRKDIVPTADQGKFRSLVLQGNRGDTFLVKVVIEFVGGGVQRIDLNRTLGAGQSVTLDLDGRRRAVQRILVYRTTDQDAATINRAHRGDFNVLAF